MRVLPILFNTEMVKAILDGRKSCTRRVIKPKDLEKFTSLFWRLNDGVVYSHIKPGDILYVRETWQEGYKLDANDQIIEGTKKYYYAAGPEDVLPSFTFWLDNSGRHRDVMPWRPSLHMPKEAARIFLKVTDVRVEQLQDITPQEAFKEGAKCSCLYPIPDCAGNKTDYQRIWDSTVNKKDLDKYGWNANPWVWVYEFERCEKPEEV